MIMLSEVTVVGSDVDLLIPTIHDFFDIRLCDPRCWNQFWVATASWTGESYEIGSTLCRE